MDDTIESLRIQEPISIPNLGLLFWLPSHVFGERCHDDWQKFISQKWTTHYAVPSPSCYEKRQDFGFKLVLNQPFRTSGFDNIDIRVDYLLRTIETDYTVDWEQGVSIDKLSLPNNFVLALKSILLNLHGTELSCYNGCIDDDDLRKVMIEFKGCETWEVDRDDLLLSIASILALEMSCN